jgi:hypothetical protein
VIVTVALIVVLAKYDPAAHPTLLLGERAPILPPTGLVTVSTQQRRKLALSVLAAAGILNVVLTVPAVEAPVQLSNTKFALAVAVTLIDAPAT